MSVSKQDSESEPTPVPTELSIDDLQNVLTAMYGARKKYMYIGLALKILKSTLDSITKKDDDDLDNLTSVLEEWLKCIDPPPTWAQLVSASEEKTVKEFKIALRLREEYCSGTKIRQETQDTVPQEDIITDQEEAFSRASDKEHHMPYMERSAQKQPVSYVTTATARNPEGSEVSTNDLLDNSTTAHVLREPHSIPEEDRFEPSLAVPPMQSTESSEKAEMVANSRTSIFQWGTPNTDPSTGEEKATREKAGCLHTRYNKLLSRVQKSAAGLIVVQDHEKLTCIPDMLEKQSLRIIDAKTIMAILSMTPTFCSFLNVDLVEYIIDSTGDEEIKHEKSLYIEDLHQFRQETSFYTFWRMLTKTFPEEPEGFQRLIVEVNWEVSDTYLESMESLRQRLSSSNPLYQCAMLLRKIKLDPVSIEWLVPASVEVICKCLKERQSDFFRNHSVVRCTLNGTTTPLYEAVGYPRMMALTKCLRDIVDKIDKGKAENLIFLSEGFVLDSQHIERVHDVFRSFRYGGNMLSEQHYLHDIFEVIGLPVDSSKVDECELQNKEVTAGNFTYKYLFYRCLTQIARQMDPEDVQQMATHFIHTWDGIQYEDTTTAQNLFRVLIRRNIIGPQKLEVLFNVMGYIKPLYRHREYVKNYLHVTGQQLIPPKDPSLVIMPAAFTEVESILEKLRSVVFQSSAAEQYVMREIEIALCGECTYKYKKSGQLMSDRCEKCPNTKIEYRGIAQVFCNYSAKFYQNDEDYKLKRILNKLGYYVFVNQDCPKKEFEIILKKRRDEYEHHEEYDSFVCCFISKGENGKVLDSQGLPCDIAPLAAYFSNEQCPSLEGKPRVFLVQIYSENINCCVLPTPQLDFLYVSLTLPTEHQVKGSHFITILKEVVEKVGLCSDLVTILTKVNQQIVENTVTTSDKKNFVPVIVSCLQKRICFPIRSDRSL